MVPAPASSSRPRLVPPLSGRGAPSYVGHAQLSLVEHALCPIDAAASLEGPFIHETEYAYTDENRHRKTAHARVACPDGLSPSDEFYLWGLLSLTFSQSNPSADFYATPYYCLRHLACIDPSADRSGGKNYTLFRNAISRLSTVSYRNDRFYDPIRAEHRDVGFGFLSYSLPIDSGSSRAWRFAWDPLFFEFCQAAAGALRFRFDTYRTLDPATRRLYLLLRKIFWRNDYSPEFDLRDLAVNVIGFTPHHETWKLKQKLLRCFAVLLEHRIVRLPEGSQDLKKLFSKRARGEYSVRLHRGPHFDEVPSSDLPSRLTDSPLYDPLHTIGLDDAAIRRILRTYEPRLIAECADMTLAAKERFGMEFFKNSPPAYFIDNIREQAARRRTPPDWWREMRKEEERRRWKATHDQKTPSKRFDDAFDEYLKTEAREAFHRVIDRIFTDLSAAGQTEADARANATHFARTHFVSRFRAEHPEWRDDEGPVRFIDGISR